MEALEESRRMRRATQGRPQAGEPSRSSRSASPEASRGLTAAGRGRGIRPGATRGRRAPTRAPRARGTRPTGPGHRLQGLGLTGGVKAGYLPSRRGRGGSRSGRDRNSLPTEPGRDSRQPLEAPEDPLEVVPRSPLNGDGGRDTQQTRKGSHPAGPARNPRSVTGMKQGRAVREG
jgi:hypothetical protein